MAERKNIVKGKIGNALESVAPDHIVAVAKDIFDESRQQYQNEINDEFGAYEDNPEFVRIYTDCDNRVIWAIKKDGSIYFGAGIPSQIIEYINNSISVIVNGSTGEDIDSLNKIIAFLDEFSTSDRLKNYLDETYGTYEDNPEFVYVKVDVNKRMLNAFKKDGTEIVFGDLQVYGAIKHQGIITKIIDNPEYLYAKTDSKGRILLGIRTKDGKLVADVAGVSSDTKKYIDDRLATDTHLKVSVLGDSISTFNGEGYKIDGYSMQYPLGDVTNVNDTWWKQVINELGGKLEVNASSAGSTASNLEIGFSPRVPLLGNPDLIFIELGTNDSANSVDIGTINYDEENPDLSKFAPAYIDGIKKVKELYPNSNVVCVSFLMEDAYANVIKSISTHYGCTYIDLRADGIPMHPNKKYMGISAGNTLLFIQKSLSYLFKQSNNPEYISAEVDEEGKLLGGRKTDGTKVEKVGFETPIINVDGSVTKTINDPEKRSEIKTDVKGKILSYRDNAGVLHENVGIAPEKIYYSEEGEKDVKALSEEQIESIGIVPKTYNMPEYGTINMVEETFYLTADDRYSDLSGITLIQDFEDTQENAQAAKTLSYYYINATLKDNGDGTYSKYNDGIAGHDVKLAFYAASKVTKVNDKYYVTASLVDGQVVPESIEVTQIKDVPPYKAWPVDKKTEHYCKVVINFGHYLSGTLYIGVKYQGSSTLYNRKRNWRFTFYKNSSFAKKNKIKIGELVRLSGYNLKANWTDASRVKEWILYRIILEIWNKRPITDRFPWDKEFGYYTGATGTIKGFPVKVSVGGDFYGMHIFSLKKDEKNYMLDGTDASGIFVCGNRRDPGCWTEAVPSDWDEEMLDEMSEDTARALNVFFAFINERVIYMGSDNKEYAAPDLTDVGGIMYVTSTLVEGQVVPESISATPTEVKPFDTDTIPERMDVMGFIDYLICLQVFSMWDSTCRNLILHSRADKKKFYPFFYDVDLSLNGEAEGDFFDRTYDIVDDQKRWYDTSLWQNIRDLYWDEMVNRYCELRSSVLNENYINYLWTTSMSQVPDEDYTLENNRWVAYTSKARGEELLNKIKERLAWLDENYFIV